MAHAITGLAEGASRVPSSESRAIQDEIIYFVMPDRFDNADPDNDTGGIPGGRLAHGFDPTDKGFWHGGDFAGLTRRLDYIRGLGATALWLTPVFVNKPVQGPPGHASAGYHGYWITDFTTTDPHLGTESEFAALVAAAHERGMRVFLDIVVNHTADVIQYRECHVRDAESGVSWSDCGYRPIAEYPYTTRGGVDGESINKGFTPGAGEERDFDRLTDPNWAWTPFIPEDEADIKRPAWLNDPVHYHNRGNTHWTGESSLHGDFSGLDDVFTGHPRVVEGMIEIFSDWITRHGIDGFRVDTVRHVEDVFWRAFVPAIRRHARNEGRPGFYIFGEAWAENVAELARFTHEAAMPAVLDFAFQARARGVIADGQPPLGLAELFAADAAYAPRRAPAAGRRALLASGRQAPADGHARARELPTFLGNHDMGRIGHFLLQAHGHHAADEMLVKRMLLGHALMIFARGVPVIYYGDEQGFTGDGGDKDAREDMFESRVASYNDNRLIGTSASTAAANFDTDHPIYQGIATMAAIYHAEPGLRRGRQTVRFAADEPGLFVFERAGAGARYLVALNTADHAHHRRVLVAPDSAAWQRIGGTGPETLETRHAGVEVALPGLAWAVYRETEADAGDGAGK